MTRAQSKSKKRAQQAAAAVQVPAPAPVQPQDNLNPRRPLFIASRQLVADPATLSMPLPEGDYPTSEVLNLSEVKLGTDRVYSRFHCVDGPAFAASFSYLPGTTIAATQVEDENGLKIEPIKEHVEAHVTVVQVSGPCRYGLEILFESDCPIRRGEKQFGIQIHFDGTMNCTSKDLEMAIILRYLSPLCKLIKALMLRLSHARTQKDVDGHIAHLAGLIAKNN